MLDRSLPDLETAITLRGSQIRHVDVFNPRRRWSVSQAMFEPIEPLPIALGGNLDAPVRGIPYPAVEAFAPRSFIREEAKPDALDASADEISSCEAHTEKELNYIRPRRR